jgi:hypothetical protein
MWAVSLFHGATLRRIRIDHRRADSAVSESRLKGPDSIMCLEHVTHDAVAKRVGGGALRNPGVPTRVLTRLVRRRSMQRIPPVFHRWRLGRGVVHEVGTQYEATRLREHSPEPRRVCATGHRGNPSSAEARHRARSRVTPAVVAPGCAACPVMDGERAADSLVACGTHETSDKHPDRRVTILYTQHVRIWLCRPAIETSQIQPIMPKAAGASGVLLK